MALRHQYEANHNSLRAGFSFLEVLVVMTLIIGTLSIGLPISWDFYTTYQFTSEVNTFISSLEQARNAALNNRNESAHGVYQDTGKFTVFQGSSYATRNTSYDKTFPRNSLIVIGGPSAIVFARLAATTSSSTFTFTNNQRNWNIQINSEGGIVY